MEFSPDLVVISNSPEFRRNFRLPSGSGQDLKDEIFNPDNKIPEATFHSRKS